MPRQDIDVMLWFANRCWRFPGAKIDTDSWEGELRSDGTMLLRDDTGAVIEGIEIGNPEDTGVSPSPTPEERRRRELLLARVMLVAADIVVAGDPLGLGTARDLIREVQHCYPELVDELL